MAATLAALAAYAGSAASAIGAGAGAIGSGLAAGAGAVGSGLAAGAGALGSAFGAGSGAAGAGATGALGGDALGTALASSAPGYGVLAPEAATGALGGSSLLPGAGIAAPGATALPEFGSGMSSLLGSANQAASWLTRPGHNVTTKVAKAANVSNPDLGEMQILGDLMDNMAMGAGSQGSPTQMYRGGNVGNLQQAGQQAPGPGGGYVVGPDGILHWQGGT